MGEHELTALLERWRGGDREAGDALMERIYGELHRMAERVFGHERGDHTLQATALVHEAYLRLIEGGPGAAENRACFLGLAAHVFRRLLVEHARKRGAAKRGGGRVRVTLAEDALAELPDRAPDVLELEEALDRLGEEDPVCVQVVERKFYGGLSTAEIAADLGIGTATVSRKWNYAKAWLYRELKGEKDGPG